MTGKPVKGVLVLMRHGETEQNTRYVMTGRMDVPLNATGEAQARAAGELLKGIIFDKAYSSSLSRAFNTASLALKEAGQKIAVEKRDDLMEADGGAYTGRGIESDPEVAKFVKLRCYNTAPPGGESDKDVVARVRKFYETEVLPRLQRGENVLVVSHSGTTRAFDIVLGLEKEPADNAKRPRRFIDNATPGVHEFENDVCVKSYDIPNPKSRRAPPPPKAA